LKEENRVNIAKWLGREKEGGEQKMTRLELLAKIQGEVTDKADKYRQEIADDATRSVVRAATEIDEIVKGYQAIAEAMPLDLLELLEKGGRIDIRTITAGTRPPGNLITMGPHRDDDIEFEVVVRNGCSGHRLPRLTLPPGEWEMVLLARRISK